MHWICAAPRTDLLRPIGSIGGAQQASKEVNGESRGGRRLGHAQRLGIEQGQVVQELGWDTDTDGDIAPTSRTRAVAKLLDGDADG